MLRCVIALAVKIWRSAPAGTSLGRSAGSAGHSWGTPLPIPGPKGGAGDLIPSPRPQPWARSGCPVPLVHPVRVVALFPKPARTSLCWGGELLNPELSPPSHRDCPLCAGDGAGSFPQQSCSSLSRVAAACASPIRTPAKPGPAKQTAEPKRTAQCIGRPRSTAGKEPYGGETAVPVTC